MRAYLAYRHGQEEQVRVRLAHFTRNQTNRQLCSPWGTRPRSWANRSLGRALRPVVQALRVRFLRAVLEANALPLRYSSAGAAEGGDTFCARRSMDMTWGQQDGRHTEGVGTGSRAGGTVLIGMTQVQWRGVARRRRHPLIRVMDAPLPPDGKTLSRPAAAGPGGGSARAAPHCLLSGLPPLCCLRTEPRPWHRRKP